MPKERPIIFSAQMVRAILEDRKTQTRRVMRPQPSGLIPRIRGIDALDTSGEWIDCPYGQPGDKLWVREGWGIGDSSGRLVDPCLNYRADGAQRPLVRRTNGDWVVNGFCVFPRELAKIRSGWRSPICMPRWASRLTLELTRVRVERVQNISEADAFAEGCQQVPVSINPESPGSYVYDFCGLWDKLNAKRGYGWDMNPWVWVLEFRRL